MRPRTKDKLTHICNHAHECEHFRMCGHCKLHSRIPDCVSAPCGGYLACNTACITGKKLERYMKEHFELFL